MQVRTNILAISGGTPPWEGDQQFQLEVKNRNSVTTVTVNAKLQLPPMVVTTTRQLLRDHILTNEDLTISPIPKLMKANEADFCTDLESVIGKRLLRSISVGMPIASESLGNPIVIERSQLIEVESAVGSVTVRTNGRALDSGSVGDSIPVELQPTKKRVQALITAPLKVSVGVTKSIARDDAR